MELSYALTWMVATSSVFGLAMSLKQLRAGVRGSFYVNLILLALVIGGVLADMQYIGYVGLAVWVLLVVVPDWAEHRQLAAFARGELAAVARYGKLSAALHPFDGRRQQARLYASLHHFEDGRSAEAKGVLYELLADPEWAERARLELLRMDERWAQIADHARAQRVGTRDLRLASLYLHAFGELGELEALWKMYSEVPEDFAARSALDVVVASYSGLVDVTEALLKNQLQALPESRATLIRATALLTAGQVERGRALLAELLRCKPFTSATQRYAHPPPPARLDTLSQETRRRVREFCHQVPSETALPTTVASPRLPWVTIALLATLVGVFFLTIPGGSTDPNNLIRLGALVLPPSLASGTEWRIVTAGFLHLGITHLLMNCLGLWVLGRSIEHILGSIAMGVIFLVSSVGSFAFALSFVQATVVEPRIFLGASSGVLGLVGALGTHLAIGYFVHRRKALGRRIVLVVAIVVAQFVFDSFTPIVSSMLHTTGLL
ncbi:MAG TPA: rhomboid family intramembrane serine protease, partial [Polyangiaceae bacterium]|nr:rhomboid family intramembrane serine protease [Polyangiaceae bacterium]